MKISYFYYDYYDKDYVKSIKHSSQDNVDAIIKWDIDNVCMTDVYNVNLDDVDIHVLSEEESHHYVVYADMTLEQFIELHKKHYHELTCMLNGDRYLTYLDHSN